jgi:hypothetical protein
MALTQIRGEQIQQNAINNSTVAASNSYRWDGGVAYAKLNLASSIVGTDLNPNHSVEIKVLDYHTVALWDIVLNQAVTGATSDVSAVVKSAASTDTARIGTSNKGILMTGTGASGSGIQNYKVQVRDAITKKVISDGLDDQVYGQLTSSVIDDSTGTYTLSFYKSDGTAFAMATKEIFQIQTTADVAGSLSGQYFMFSSPTTDYYAWFNINTVKEVTQLDFSSCYNGAGPTGTAALAGAYFLFNSANTNYYVYFRVDGQGQDPAIAGRTSIAIDIASSATRAQIAAAVNTAFAALSAAFTSSVVGTTVTVTNAVGGNVGAPADHNVGVVFTVTKNGKIAAANPSISGRTAIEIALTEGADAPTVANAVATAIGGVTGVFTASAVGSTVTVNNVNSGVANKIVDDGSGYYGTGFLFTVSQYGTPASVDFMFLEIYSYQTAPATGFVTGFGFADVVGIAGTHNHNDLYYTKYELENGQLDNRYYTITQLNGGVLDGLYYTQAQLDPNAIQDGNVLDKRYYTETELSSSSTGSAGASLIGITSTSVSLPASPLALSASNVQDALVELQSDINNIITGASGITFSLDDAYNDGSVVVVDGKNDKGIAVSGKNAVDFKLDNGQAFKIATAADAALFEVDAAIAGNSVNLTATTNITGPTTITGSTGVVGNLTQSAGTFSVTTGTGQDASVNANSVKIDGAADSYMTATGANLTLSTASTGSINVTAANELYFKDANLTSHIPISQAGQAALSTDFLTASSIVGALNETQVDLTNLIQTTLPSVASGTSGATKIGVTGITGVTPTGGTLDGNGTVQTMLEGIAIAAGGGKTFANLAAFTAAKAAGTYFKLNEPVLILDFNRWLIVATQTTAIVQGVDWQFVGGINRNIGGTDYRYNLTGIDANTFQVTTTGGVAITAAGGVVISEANGAEFGLTAAGQAIVDSAAGQNVAISSNTKVGINGGALVDISATAVTVEGATTVTGGADNNILLTTSGTGTVVAAAANSVALTGGAVNIGAGTGKKVEVTSDTEIGLTSALKIVATGGEIDLLAGTGKKIIATTDTEMDLNGGALIDATATEIDLNGKLVDAGTTASFTLSSTAADSFKVSTTGGVVISAANGFSITEDSGANFSSDLNGVINLQAATNKSLTINTVGTGELDIYTNNGSLGLSSLASTAVDAINLNASAGGVKVDAFDGVIINAPGTTGTGNNVGIIDLSAGTVVRLDAPLTQTTGMLQVAPGNQILVDKINIQTVNPPDIATITGESTPYGTNGDVASALYINIGKDPDDRIVMRSTVDGVAFTEIFGVYQGTARVYGDLVVDGKTTTISSNDVNILDNMTTWNSGITASTQNSDAYLQIKRLTSTTPAGVIQSMSKTDGTGGADNTVTLADATGWVTGNFFEIYGATDADNNGLYRIQGITGNVLTLDKSYNSLNSAQPAAAGNIREAAPAIIRWNDGQQKFQVLNVVTGLFENLATTVGSGSINLQTAYDGGQTVEVGKNGEPSVVWTLDAGTTFEIVDATDASKFIISSGAAADSVKIATSGGIVFDAGKAINFSGTGATYSSTSTTTINSGTSTTVYGQSGTTKLQLDDAVLLENDSTSKLITLQSAGGITLSSANTKATTINTGSLSANAVLASNMSVTGADLTLSTITSGDLNLTSAGKIVETAVSEIDLIAPAIKTTGALLQTGTSHLVGALTLDGSYTQSGGDYTFLINTIDTSDTSVDVTTAGGVAFAAASKFVVGAPAINTTGVLTQVGAVGITGAVEITGSLTQTGANVSLSSTGTGNLQGLSLNAIQNVTISSGGMINNTPTGAFNVTAGAQSTISAGGGLILTSALTGNVALNAAADITFTDINASVPITFSQASAGTFSSKFAYNSQTAFNWSTRATGQSTITSVMGALDANRQDLYEFVELLNTQGASFGVAAGANLIGVKGVNGVIPTGGVLGANSNLQAMLEGLAQGAGGGKTFANLAAFTAAKQGGSYFKLYEPVFILDVNRWVIVQTQSIAIAQGVDWQFVGGVNRTIAGTYYQMSLTGTSDTSLSVATTGGILVNAAMDTIIENTAGSSINMATNGAITVTGVKPISITGSDTVSIATSQASAGSGTALSMISALGSGTKDVKIASANGGVDIESAKPFLLTSAGITATSSAAASVVVTGGALSLQTLTSGAITINSIGAFQADANANSYVNVNSANLNVETTSTGNISVLSSGDLYFKDTRVISPIKFSDSANGNNQLPAGATSILGAIQAAYENTGYESRVNYYEVFVSSAVAAQNCVVVPGGATDPGMDLPILSDGGNGWANLVPQALRSRNPAVYVSVYLNGLRLSDSEWDYVFDINGAGTGANYFAGQSNSKVIRFAQSQNVTLVSGDKISIEITMNKTGVVTPGV